MTQAPTDQLVYARLLDAFCGKLIENGNGSRDFATSDMARFADLFMRDAHRDAVFAFVRGNVCSKNENGLGATGNGIYTRLAWPAQAAGWSAPSSIGRRPTRRRWRFARSAKTATPLPVCAT